MNSNIQANQIINQFLEIENDFDKSKMCAIICVQNIINANPYSNPLNNVEVNSTMSYWQCVKNAIENTKNKKLKIGL
jgi:hypothetical protein